MIEIIKNKLIEGFDIENNPLLYRRIIIIASLMMVIVVAAVIFTPINYLQGEWLLVWIDIVFFVTTLFTLYLLIYKNQLEFAAIFSSLVLFVIIIYFTILSKNHHFELIWTVTFPLYVIPILGKKRGLAIIILFYAVLTPFVYLGINEWDNGHWNFIAFVRFMIVSIACIFSAYFFESSSIKAYKILEGSLNKEKNYLSQLEKLATTDQLTSLHNRRYFDIQFKLETQKVERYATDLSLLMLDIDHFKPINDQFGHSIGDQVLIEFSRLLKSSLRETDILARWGGEEFVILLPQISLSNAAIIAEKTRMLVKNHSFKTINQLTVSIGVAKVDSSSKSKVNALLKADRALYQAKNNGRDQVHVCEDQ